MFSELDISDCVGALTRAFHCLRALKEAIHYVSMCQWVSSITVRALAYCTEDPRFEINLEPMIGCPFTVHPAANGDLVESQGRKGGEERIWPLYQTNGPRQVPSLTGTSPTYESYMGLTFNFTARNTSLRMCTIRSKDLSLQTCLKSFLS